MDVLLLPFRTQRLLTTKYHLDKNNQDFAIVLVTYSFYNLLIHLHIAQCSCEGACMLVHRLPIGLFFKLFADSKVTDFSKAKTRLNQNVVRLNIAVNLFKFRV